MSGLGTYINRLTSSPLQFWPEALALLSLGVAFFALGQPWIRVIPPDEWAYKLPTVLLDIKTTFLFYDLKQSYLVVIALSLAVAIVCWQLRWAFLPALAALVLAYFSLRQTEQGMGGSIRWQDKGFETVLDNGLWLFMAAVVVLIVLSAYRWWMPLKSIEHE